MAEPPFLLVWFGLHVSGWGFFLWFTGEEKGGEGGGVRGAPTAEPRCVTSFHFLSRLVTPFVILVLHGATGC